MYKGIVASATFPAIREDAVRFDRAVEEVAATGLFDGFVFCFEGNAAERRRIGAALARKGFYGVYLAAFEMKRDRTDLGAADPAERSAAVARCLEQVRVACETRARKILILSGPRPQGSFDLDAYLTRFAQSLEQLVIGARAWAGDDAPEVSIEFFNDRGEPWLAVGGADTVVRLFKRVDWPGLAGRLGITFDTSHVAQLHEGLEEDYTLLSPFTRHLHLSNCVIDRPGHPLNGDRHPAFNHPDGVFPGADMAAFVQWVSKQSGADRIDVCSIEVIPHAGMDEQASFQRVCETARVVFGPYK